MYRVTTAIVGCVALFALAQTTKLSAAAATPAQYAPTNAGQVQVQDVGYRRWARRHGAPYAYGYGYGYRPYGYYRPYTYGGPYGYYGGRYAYGGPYGYYGRPYGYYGRPGISLGFAF
jgi:hypothetical protein